MKQKLVNLFQQAREFISPIKPLNVFGDNDLVGTLNHEAQVFQAIHSVGRVWIPGEKDKYGTGFMVSPDLFLTNQHVLNDQKAVENAIIWIDYDEDEDAINHSYHDARCIELLKSSPKTQMDYALVRLKFSTPRDLLREQAYVNLRTYGPCPVGGKDSVIIVQHPHGQKRQIVTRNTPVVEVLGKRIRYKADTDDGSSGAPVFDVDYRIVGLHHEGKSSWNEAIDICHILKDIEGLLPY
jgi:endonuclease G